MSTVSTQEKVWANSVPASIVAAASKQERNRQEAIFEVIQTEHNYVRDLELMEEVSLSYNNFFFSFRSIDCNASLP